MLPKPIKNLKSTTGEQLNLVDTISNEDKIKNKRRAVIIFLILTVGLSFTFWIYRSVNLFIKTKEFPNFSINLNNLKVNKLKINTSPLNTPDLEKDISSIVSKDTNIWSIYIQSTKNQDVTFSWSKNYVVIPEEINKIIDNLSQIPTSSSDQIPPGAKIQENSILEDNSYQFQTLITVPQQQFLLVFNITGNKIDAAVKLIPEIVEKIYWHLIQLV